MDTKTPRYPVLTVLGVAVALVIAGSTAVPAQTAPVLDLTGETCLSGSAVVDPDGPGGPLPPQTYCVMNGRLGMNQALEMDDTDGMAPVSGSASSVADANLFSSSDPVNDPDLPAIMGAMYLDWADLNLAPLTGPGAAPLGSVENNRILDFTANNDFTIFRPQAASCLNDGSALPKEDFTQSYIANSDQFLYFAQERRTNNGNSVYYWLITKEPPIVAASPDCSNARGQVQFRLTAGDVELLVNFPDSSDPAGGGVFFRPYLNSDSGYIPARDAVFDVGWDPMLQTAPIMNFAVNITGDGDDSFGPWGGFSKQGNPVATGSYDTATLAEWAVDLLDVLSGTSLCGQSLFVSGMSRSSTGQIGDLTEPSALKDLVGPKLYSFGEISAQATVDPGCDLAFDYSAVAFGFDGVTPLDPNTYTCSWSCTDDDGRGVMLSDAGACSGTGTIPRGDASPDPVSCTVTVDETASGCTADDDADGDVLAPILVSIAPDAMNLGCTVPATPGSDTGNIGPGVVYTPTISGGDGAYSLAWSVAGPNDAVCALNAPTCTIDIPDAAYCGRSTVYVTVDDGDPACPAVQSNTGMVLKTTSVMAN